MTTLGIFFMASLMKYVHQMFLFITTVWYHRIVPTIKPPAPALGMPGVAALEVSRKEDR